MDPNPHGYSPCYPRQFISTGLNSIAQRDWHNAQFPLNNPLHLKRDSEWFNVRFGSKADITLGPRHGRFASKSGHC